MQQPVQAWYNQEALVQEVVTQVGQLFLQPVASAAAPLLVQQACEDMSSGELMFSPLPGQERSQEAEAWQVKLLTLLVPGMPAFVQSISYSGTHHHCHCKATTVYSLGSVLVCATAFLMLHGCGFCCDVLLRDIATSRRQHRQSEQSDFIRHRTLFV